MDKTLAQYGFDTETTLDEAWEACTPELIEELNKILPEYVGTREYRGDYEDGRGNLWNVHDFVEDLFKFSPNLCRCIYIQWKNDDWRVIQRSWKPERRDPIGAVTVIAPGVVSWNGNKYVHTFHQNRTWDYYHMEVR